MDRLSWQRTMEEFISGIERELLPLTPSGIRMALDAFRVRLRARRLVGGRKHFEGQLESFVTENGAVRDAAERHLGVATVVAVEEARTALARADTVLAQIKARKKLV
jgi:hypothetical protein